MRLVLIVCIILAVAVVSYRFGYTRAQRQDVALLRELTHQSKELEKVTNEIKAHLQNDADVKKARRELENELHQLNQELDTILTDHEKRTGKK